jgi:chloride channel protein, CIC family
MLATVLADLLARTLLPHSIMTEKLARRGVTVPSTFHADPLRTTRVRGVMTANVVTIPADATRTTLEDAFRRTRHTACPVVDDAGRLVGIVSRDDLLEPDDPSTPVTRMATSEVVTLEADETLQPALSLMIEEGLDHLPVVERGQVVGICTRTDILRARMRQLDQEHLERGWLAYKRAPRV